MMQLFLEAINFTSVPTLQNLRLCVWKLMFFFSKYSKKKTVAMILETKVACLFESKAMNFFLKLSYIFLKREILACFCLNLEILVLIQFF